MKINTKVVIDPEKPNNKSLFIELELFTQASGWCNFTLSPQETKTLISKLESELQYLNEGQEVLAGGCR